MTLITKEYLHTSYGIVKELRSWFAFGAVLIAIWRWGIPYGDSVASLPKTTQTVRNLAIQVPRDSARIDSVKFVSNEALDTAKYFKREFERVSYVTDRRLRNELPSFNNRRN